MEVVGDSEAARSQLLDQAMESPDDDLEAVGSDDDDAAADDDDEAENRHKV